MVKVSKTYVSFVSWNKIFSKVLFLTSFSALSPVASWSNRCFALLLLLHRNKAMLLELEVFGDEASTWTFLSSINVKLSRDILIFIMFWFLHCDISDYFLFSFICSLFSQLIIRWIFKPVLITMTNLDSM